MLDSWETMWRWRQVVMIRVEYSVDVVVLVERLMQAFFDVVGVDI